MPEPFVYNVSAVADTDAFITAITVTGDGEVRRTPSVPAAKVGALTTRASDTAGTLTMGDGHGVETGDELHVYHAGGLTIVPAVGTVAGAAVPFTGATGAVLPADESDVTAMVPVERPFLTAGDDVRGLGVTSPVQGTVRFFNDSPAEILSYTFGATGGAAALIEGNGATNPLAGAAVATVKFSHADPAAAQTLKAYVVQ